MTGTLPKAVFARLVRRRVAKGRESILSFEMSEAQEMVNGKGRHPRLTTDYIVSLGSWHHSFDLPPHRSVRDAAVVFGRQTETDFGIDDGQD